MGLTSESSNQPSSTPGDVFATTHWTVVLAAGELVFAYMKNNLQLYYNAMTIRHRFSASISET
jgi:hypothetical protein